jgi:hypothetical protein
VAPRDVSFTWLVKVANTDAMPAEVPPSRHACRASIGQRVNRS